MEVHHHTHTERPRGGRAGKKFNHYLWEFLMLFLAVFAGFLAENMREHYVEHQRELQYMRSMIKDLEQDQRNIQKSIADETRTIPLADSLIQLFDGNDYKTKGGQTYYAARDFATLPSMFYMTDGTLMQLKNSGGLRLIRKQRVVDSLQAYYNRYLWYKTGQELEFVQLDDYRSSMRQIFDVQVFNSMVKGYPEIIMPGGNPPLLNTEPLLINELLMRAHFCKRSKLANLIDLKKLGEQVARLIGQIESEYHLSNG
jgi:hypothetical protein